MNSGGAFVWWLGAACCSYWVGVLQSGGGKKNQPTIVKAREGPQFVTSWSGRTNERRRNATCVAAHLHVCTIAHPVLHHTTANLPSGSLVIVESGLESSCVAKRLFPRHNTRPWRRTVVNSLIWDSSIDEARRLAAAKNKRLSSKEEG